MGKSNQNKVLKGVSSQSLVTLMLGLVEIISFSIMSRLLTQEDFGYYAAITAITTVFSSFSETGIGAAIVQKKEIDSQYLNNAFSISFLFGLFISLLLVVLSGPLSRLVLDGSLQKPLMLMSITLICHCLTSINVSIMHRKLQFLRIGLINLVALVSTTIIAIVLALHGYGYYAILTKAILTSVFTLLLSFLFVRIPYRFQLDKETFSSIFGFSGWLMASVFFRNFAQQADKLLMGRLLSINALGEYNRPKEFINQISSKLNGIFDSALFPVLSSIQDNKKSMANAYSASFYYLNIMAMLLVLLFVFNHELIIRVFLGEQWMNTKYVFVILSLALVFNIDGRLSDCYFRSLGLTREQFFFRIVELCVKLVAILIGAAAGLIGVATAVVFANLVMIVIKTLYISTRVGVSPGETLRIVLKSWRFSLVEIPVLVVAYIFLPHTWTGSILLAVIFLAINVILFCFIPQIIGKEYEAHAYRQVQGYLKKFIKIR